VRACMCVCMLLLYNSLPLTRRVCVCACVKEREIESERVTQAKPYCRRGLGNVCESEGVCVCKTACVRVGWGGRERQSGIVGGLEHVFSTASSVLYQTVFD